MLANHEGLITASASHLQHAIDSLTQTVTRLAAQLQQQSPAGTSPVSSAPAAASLAPVLASDSPEPRVGSPERFDGNPENCSPFLTNCTLFFALQPRTFASELAKVAFTINHLTGRARLWGTAEWDRQSPACQNFSAFAAELRKVFGHNPARSEVAAGLLNLKQGQRSVADFSIDFRIRASRSGWNPAAQIDAFMHGLADYIKEELVSHEVPSSFDNIIDLAIRIDLRVQTRRRERRQGSSRQSL